MYFIVWPWSFWRTVNVFLSDRKRYHRNKSIRWGLILRSTSYCWFCISNVCYHFCLWFMCCFGNALLFFIKIIFFYRYILKKTKNNENEMWKNPNIKTPKKPKLIPIIFSRKYDFQNIEYVISIWISIKKKNFVDVADSTTMMMIYSIYVSNGICLPFANRLCFDWFSTIITCIHAFIEYQWTQL